MLCVTIYSRSTLDNIYNYKLLAEAIMKDCENQSVLGILMRILKSTYNIKQLSFAHAPITHFKIIQRQYNTLVVGGGRNC